jgi:hypothetical protein
MNDEDLARQAFAAAFRSGHTGEPPTLPDVELLALHGRRANRNRHGAYVAGTTALAGVVVAGVVTGPALLGFGSNSPSGIETGAAGSTPTASPSPTSAIDDPLKPSPGVPCATPPAIDWISVINHALPAGVTATADHSASCNEMPDGSRTVQALFKLSTGTVELQVTVGSGPNIARKVGSAPGMAGIAPATDSAESLDPSTLASLEAKKQALASAGATASGAPGSAPSASLDPAAIASLEAMKQAIASAHATASPAPGAGAGDGTKGVDNQNCSIVGSDENACVSHVTKGPLSVVDVQLMRTGGAPLILDVAASNGKDPSVPATGQLPSDATMVAIAQAVATHF